MRDDVVLLLLITLPVTAIILWLRHTYQQKINFKENVIKELNQRLALQEKQSFSNKNELNAILSSMVEGVVVIGINEQIVYVSPNAQHMFQLRSKDVAGKPYWEIIPYTQINIFIKEALLNKSAINKEIMLMGTKDTFFSMQISPVFQQGQLTSIVVIFHNITDLKDLLKMRSEFVANVSHELKTPLTSIKGFVETLNEEGGLDDKLHAKKFLSIIHKQTQRLEALVSDLLVISSIESKEKKMEFMPQSIEPVISSVIAMQKKAIDQAGLRIEVHVPNDLPKIAMDRNQMEQVFINLLDNAVKYTPSGGSITVTAVVMSPWLQIEFKDTGIGIAPEYLSRIFERFYRVDKSRNDQTGGTGLGLSIVKHIVASHHGRVEVKSAPGQGAAFIVSLPIN